MAQEIDARDDIEIPPLAGPANDTLVRRRRDELAGYAEAASRALPGDHEVQVVSVDPESGGAAVVVSQGAPAIEGDFVARALRHLHAMARILGLEPTQPPEFVADPGYQLTSSGGVAVHVRQQLQGVTIYDATETVRFDAAGRLLEVAGRSYPAVDSTIDPRLGAADALTAAVGYLAAPAATSDPAGDLGVGSRDPDPSHDPFGEPLAEATIDLDGFAPRVLAAPIGGPDLATVFDAPPLTQPVTVSLIWFPLGASLRLAWHLRAQLPGDSEYRVIVDAEDGDILLCRRLTRMIVGHAQVILRSGGPRSAVDFPLPPSSYGPPIPSGLPAGWPDSWLVDATTSGSSVRAVDASAGNTTVSGTRQGDEVTFTAPTDVDDVEQLVVNVFAFCSAMHDALYLLGFREADGNFQRDSMARGGRPADAVIARVHPGAVNGTANMATPVDGFAPVMNMGLVTSTGRHTALDADVVYHEYVHGLTNRLVGGPMNDTALDAERSGGMGEGWSDYVACTFLGKTVVGDWVVRQPGGIRRNPYDEAFPGTYADLGTPAYSQVHDIGELWCAVLMSLGRRLGVWEFLQIVVDALKLTGANPSLLAARDAILMAAAQFSTARGDESERTATFVADAWQVFARYGLGPVARTNGPRLSGIVADFGVAADLVL